MNNKKLGAIVVLALLVLVISWLIPNVAGAGRENSLVQRVEGLEEQVALLTARVEELEEGGGGACACSCDVLHLTPLADFPAEPSEGDLCVVDASGDGWHVLLCYLHGGWNYLTVPPPTPPITPSPPIIP